MKTKTNFNFASFIWLRNLVLYVQAYGRAEGVQVDGAEESIWMLERGVTGGSKN